ncbi:MAG TPA: ferric reductase-like transmembrane domain-containing protein [Candidatus Dormibacteraeota bacterium]
MNDTILWYATRGAGIVSLILLTGVVLLGIVSAMRWQTASWPRFLTTGFHRNLALATLIFLSLHVVTAVVDPFTALGWNAALVPFSSSYRRFWLGLGVVAIYLLLAIVLTSLLRPIFGHRAWRTVHWLSYAMWPVAVIHGIGTGTDPWFAWMLAIEALCIGGVVAAVAWRVGRVAPTAWRQIPTASPRAQKWS